MTKRPVLLYAAVLPLVLTACFLFPTGGCARPSLPGEPWEETPVLPRHPVLEGAEGRAVRADDGAALSTGISARGENQAGGGAAKSRRWSASSSRSRSPPPLLLSSKMAQWVLAGAPPLEGAERRAVRADSGAASTATATAPARGEDQGGVARSGRWTASSSRSPPPRSANLARRILAGAPPGEGSAGAADSAARSSCKSSDVNVGCPPHH